MLSNKSKSCQSALFLTMGLMFNLVAVAADEKAPVADVATPGYLERFTNRAKAVSERVGTFVEGLADSAEEKLANQSATTAVADAPVVNAEVSKVPVVSPLLKTSKENLADVASATPIVAKNDQPAPVKTDASSVPAPVVTDSWNTTYVVGGVAAAAVMVGAIGYWYATMSWHRTVNKLVAKAQLNPNAIIDDLSVLLESWDGSAQQQQIVEYVEARVALTPELVALLDLYRY